MDDQGLRVADVREVAHELRCLDERLSRVASAPDAEGQYRARALRQVLSGQRVVRARFQAGIVHPAHQRMGFEESGDPERVLAVPVHAHVQRLESLQEQERVERAERRSEGAKRLAARAHGEPEIAERLVEAHAVVPARRLGHARELAVVPRELPRLDDHAADRRPVAADELRRGVGDEVRAPLEGAAQVRRRERVVDHQRQPGVAGDRRHRLDVEHVDEGVPDGLGVQHPRVVADGPREVLGVVRVHEGGLDAELGEVHVELRVAPAIELARGDDVVPRLEEGQECGHLCRHPRRGGDRGPAAFERRHALLEHGGRRVHQPRVDVPEGLEVEQARGVIGVVEHVGGGLVDRRRPRPGGGIGKLPGVQAQGLEVVFVVCHG